MSREIIPAFPNRIEQTKQTGMAILISILRGINVSGKNMIRMVALKKMYENNGFTDVQTYVQSGNVTFRAENSSPEELQQVIENSIKQEFGFDVPVIVLTVEKLQRIIAGNPFSQDPEKDPAFMHVTFLSAPPAWFDPGPILAKKTEGEEIVFSREAVYLYCPGGYGNTKLSNQFLENKLGVKATTRNWKTTNQLVRISLQPANDV
jgi:uncharacterized protein (DUF1697 family)